MTNKASVVLALSLLACAGEALDDGLDPAGSNHQGSGAAGGTGGAGNSTQELAATATLPDWATVGTCPTGGEPAPQFVGTWEGAVEDFYLNPLLPIRLVVTHATSEGICGTLSWGVESPPPVPLTDPAQTGREFGFGGATGFPHEGLTYTIVQGAGRDETLRFAISAHEPWQDFCAMQNALHYHPNLGAYTCMEQYTYLELPESGDTCTLHSHDSTTLPIKQCAGCDGRHVCMCNAAGCAASTQPTGDFSLVLGSTLDGIDVLATNNDTLGLQAIHLERVDPG